jgi:hypothetical protein
VVDPVLVADHLPELTPIWLPHCPPWMCRISLMEFTVLDLRQPAWVLVRRLPSPQQTSARALSDRSPPQPGWQIAAPLLTNHSSLTKIANKLKRKSNKSTSACMEVEDLCLCHARANPPASIVPNQYEKLEWRVGDARSIFQPTKYE